MRIGDFKDSDKSDDLIRLIQSDPSENLTGIKKWKNWWHYYKWYVVCGILLTGIICNLAGNALGLWRKKPDLQIAYVGQGALPQDTVDALEKAFASIAQDYNEDGSIIVQINQYTDSAEQGSAEAASYKYASEIALIGDISGAESYLFLLDDPQNFQQEFQLLAEPDGSCPADTDLGIDGKVIAWSDCPLLAEMDLGAYHCDILGQTITGSNQDLLSGLYLGRRCFYAGTAIDYAEAYDALWNTLIHTDQEVFP